MARTVEPKRADVFGSTAPARKQPHPAGAGRARPRAISARDEDWDAIRSAARRSRKSVSRFIVDLAAKAEVELGDHQPTEDAIYELARIGTAIRRALNDDNEGRFAPQTEGALRSALTDLQQWIREHP